jgi:hypothetical protein
MCHHWSLLTSTKCLIVMVSQEGWQENAAPIRYNPYRMRRRARVHKQTFTPPNLQAKMIVGSSLRWEPTLKPLRSGRFQVGFYPSTLCETHLLPPRLAPATSPKIENKTAVSRKNERLWFVVRVLAKTTSSWFDFLWYGLGFFCQDEKLSNQRICT